MGKGVLEKLLAKYDYPVPPEQIAQKPASPRDSAKMLVYRRATQQVKWDTFSNLPNYLPQGAVLIFNDTKVIPARLTLHKATGGRVKILVIGREKKLLKIMADRKLMVGMKLFLKPKTWFTVASKLGNFYHLAPSFPLSQWEQILEKFGETPIPPYIKHSPLSEKELREKYQTVFAKHKGSIAAPTASLHFTARLLKELRARKIAIQFVTLHVHLGTFALLTEEHVRSGKLHREFYEISTTTAKALNEAKKRSRPIIAVGTTVARSLESASTAHGKLTKLSGSTTLFIREPYHFTFVDGLITNFHIPRSSLLMLVSAFASRNKILDLYRQAAAKKFRFFSFGDGMLML